MSIEQAVLEAMRALTATQQQEVLDFAEFLRQKAQRSIVPEPAEPQARQEQAFKPQSALGKKLREIRQQAIESGLKLMSVEEIEQEIAEQRHRHYYNDENLS